MDNRTLLARLRAIADEIDANPEVSGSGASHISDGPFLRDLADEVEEAEANMVFGKAVIERIAGKLTRA